MRETLPEFGRKTPSGSYVIKAELQGFKVAQNAVELHVEEALRVSLTLEAFNVFNYPIWGDPIMAITSPLYGTINTTRSPMREIQIGMKFAF